MFVLILHSTNNVRTADPGGSFAGLPAAALAAAAAPLAMGSKTDRNTQRAKPAEQPDDEEELEPDHATLLSSTMPLLRSRNAGVVVAVATLFHYLAPRSQVDESDRACGWRLPNLI